jgi:hypothetical protein
MNIISQLNRWQQKSKAIAPVLKQLRHNTHKTILAGVVILATSGLSACSFSVGGLDMNKLKEAITTGVEAQTGVEITSIDCPPNRDVEEGDTFDCTATIEDGNSLTIKVTQTDDQGNINWEVVDPEESIASEPTSVDDSSPEDTSDDPDAPSDTTINSSQANSGNTLNTAKLVEAITTGITDQTGLGVESVDCPDRPISAGDVFNCTAYGMSDSTMTVQVEQKDNLGNINWEIVGSTRILDLDVMEQQIVEQLTEQTGVSGVVECGSDRYKVAGAGDEFECTGRDNNGNEGIIKVTVQDDSGNYRWEIN